MISSDWDDLIECIAIALPHVDHLPGWSETVENACMSNHIDAAAVCEQKEMAKATTIKAAVAEWEKTHPGSSIADAEKVTRGTICTATFSNYISKLCLKHLITSYSPQVELWGLCPPIEKMDAGLAVLKSCR